MRLDRRAESASRTATREATKAHRVLADHGRGMTFLVGRRRHAVERGPRLHPAADHPSRRPQARRDRARGAVPARLAGRRRRADGRRGIRRSSSTATRSTRVVRAEEERFRETLERGLRQFEALARRAKRSPARRRSARRHVRLPDRADAGAGGRARARRRRRRSTAADGAASRDLARGRRRRATQRAAELRRARLPERVRRLREDRGADADRGARGARRGHLPGEAARVAVLPGRRRPGHGHGVHRARRRDRRDGRAARGIPLRGRPGAAFRGEGFAAGDRVRAVVPWAVRFPTMANHTATHLLHKALQRRARRPRHARPGRRCGPTSCASTSRTRRR